MAEKKSSERRTSQRWSSTKVLDCLAYFAIIFIAIALVLRLIFKKHSPSVASAFQSIGEAVAYVICIWLGFYWTRRHRNIWWFICWLVAAVLITVIYIFALTA